MKQPDIDRYKEQLLYLRARLRGDVTAMAQSALHRNEFESGERDAEDLDSDNFDHEATLKLLQSEEDTLGRIEAALELIDNGVYGSCVACGGRIPKARLNAIPYAVHCVSCASEIEQK